MAIIGFIKEWLNVNFLLKQKLLFLSNLAPFLTFVTENDQSKK
jgi:hypothetical protein